MRLGDKSNSFILWYHRFYDYSPLLVSFLYTIFVMIIYNKNKMDKRIYFQVQYVVEEFMQTFIRE